ncbi:hypothetical protein AWJ20_4785 [Sugiyamaella lignohabitans]|uniref:Uncharacterized protein n=1 Tax=Sugiyamaella lignohabitans TaxID=796027 RepID=A0A167EAI1_9ASCO|nr:uncharacterized protein AWJ20_4785 [Sugiyamaella lignohabitans]ANB13838.1 hypothetical protein AWJ20_4785 [Sugiyamaella lignohabitans]
MSGQDEGLEIDIDDDFSVRSVKTGAVEGAGSVASEGASVAASAGTATGSDVAVSVEAGAEAVPAVTGAGPVADDSMDVEVTDSRKIEAPGSEGSQPGAEENALVPRPVAVHLIGVNDLSTDEVEKYVGYYYPRIKYRVQWVDDSSCK